MSTNDNYAERTAEQHQYTIDRIVADLHRMADDFACEAIPRKGAIDRARNPYTNAAAVAVHHLHCGLANVLIENMIANAAEVDRAMLEEQILPTSAPAFRTLTSDEFWTKVVGTYGVGEVNVSYAELVDMFGEPLKGDEYKVDVEWLIEFADGTIAMVYNYKDGINYLGSEGMPTADITCWHIGGVDVSACEKVRSVLSSRLDAEVKP